MELGRIGVWTRGLREAAERGDSLEAAAEVEELGFGAIFIPGGVGGEVLGAVEGLLGATGSIAVATGILNVWMHEPGDVAAAFDRIDRAHPGRFHLGLGISHAPLVEGPGGQKWDDRPLARLGAYLDDLDAALAPVPPDRRLLAALGPRALDLAARRSAGTHPYFTPPAHTRAAREAVGPDAIVAPEVTVLVEADPATARQRARDFMELYLGLPNYTNNLLRHGFTDDDLAHGGSDRLVDAIVAWGDEGAIAARVGEHLDAGADHVCIQVLGSDRAAIPIDDWRRLAPALIG